MTVVRNFSFAGGEIAPSLYARTDQTKYQTGARQLKNAYVPRSGGAFQRPGTQFVGEIKASEESARLIPFIFDQDNAYVLEFGLTRAGAGRLRFIKQGAYILETANTVSVVYLGTSTLVTFTTVHGYSTGDTVSFYDLTGTVELNGRDFLVSVVDTTSITIKYNNGTDVDSSAYSVSVAGGNCSRIYEKTTSYAASDLKNIKFTQSADVMYLVCAGLAPKKLSRTSDTNWAFVNLTIITDQDSVNSASNNGAAGAAIEYTVHGIGSDGEFGQGAITTTNSSANSTNAVTVTFSLTATAAYYAILRNDALLGYTSTNSFIDNGITPQWYDILGNAPMSEADTLFLSTARRPGAVGFYQQRLLFGNIYDGFTTESFPERVCASFIGHYQDFFSLGPIAGNANYPFSFDVAGRQLNTIRHIVDLERLVLFTPGGVYVAQGDDAGALSSTSINLRQISYSGSANLRPLIANESLIYLESRRSLVRDLNFQIQTDGYKGNDLTVFAKHLVDGHTIEDWDFQLNPDSMLFAAREDGVMLGLTYVKEQQITAWHRHVLTAADTDANPSEDASVECICVIPEDDKDVVYMIVRRTNASADPDSEAGREKAYVERMELSTISDIKDVIYMDSALSYDGRSTDGTEMTLTGSGWTSADSLTLTSSVVGTPTSAFTASDVGNEIQLTGSDGTFIRFLITAFTSTSQVTGKPDKDVPESMQAIATTDWAMAVDEISSLWHLEGYKVSILADGYVAASPINDAYDQYTVTNGSITLNRPYAVIHIGLPYVTDIETLDIDTANGESLVDKKKLIQKVSVWVQDTRSLWAGLNPNNPLTLEGLEQPALRDMEGYDEPNDLSTGVIDVNIQGEWNSNGRILLRNVDPIPMNILSVAPSGLIPFRG